MGVCVVWRGSDGCVLCVLCGEGVMGVCVAWRGSDGCVLCGEGVTGVCVVCVCALPLAGISGGVSCWSVNFLFLYFLSFLGRAGDRLTTLVFAVCCVRVCLCVCLTWCLLCMCVCVCVCVSYLVFAVCVCVPAALPSVCGSWSGPPIAP